MQQLHEHRPQDVQETDAQLAELVAADLIKVIVESSGDAIVSINPAALGLAPGGATDSRG